MKPVRPELAKYVGQEFYVSGTVSAVGEYLCLQDVSFADTTAVKTKMGWSKYLQRKDISTDHFWATLPRMNLLPIKVGSSIQFNPAVVTTYWKGFTVEPKMGALYRNLCGSVFEQYEDGTNLIYTMNDTFVDKPCEDLPALEFDLENPIYRSTFPFALQRVNLEGILRRLRTRKAFTDDMLEAIWTRQGKPLTKDWNTLIARETNFLRKLGDV